MICSFSASVILPWARAIPGMESSKAQAKGYFMVFLRGLIVVGWSLLATGHDVCSSDLSLQSALSCTSKGSLTSGRRSVQVQHWSGLGVGLAASEVGQDRLEGPVTDLDTDEIFRLIFIGDIAHGLLWKLDDVQGQLTAGFDQLFGHVTGLSVAQNLQNAGGRLLVAKQVFQVLCCGNRRALFELVPVHGGNMHFTAVFIAGGEGGVVQALALNARDWQLHGIVSHLKGDVRWLLGV